MTSSKKEAVSWQESVHSYHNGFMSCKKLDCIHSTSKGDENFNLINSTKSDGGILGKIKYCFKNINDFHQIKKLK